MPRIKKGKVSPPLTPTEDSPAIRYLEREIIGGKHWYLALLEAIGIWEIPEETHNGRTYRYLVGGEAFDWLLLTERLCQAVDVLLPDDEKEALLFQSEPPLNISTVEFRELIGSTKYHQYLNFFYGITVEEALVLAVEDKIRKERRVSGYYREKDTTNEAFRRIYGATKTILLRRFRKTKGYPQLKSTSLDELKEFTYWLFKHRLAQSDKAKVASDTKKALNWLKRGGFSQRPDKHDLGLEFVGPVPVEPVS